MKHLPNLLTLANLFCGCLAIVYIIDAQPFLYIKMDGRPEWNWVYGIQQICLGSLFIALAGVFDVLDGLAARALRITSPIGKDLDSLADVVSFGVAPSLILYKFLWDAAMMETDALDASMVTMAPAFLIACFAALRLAKFNVTASDQKGFFIGMPTPAVGLFIASLPFISKYNPMGMADYLKYKWVLYGIIVVLCWLMVSKIRFIKLMPAQWRLANTWPQLALVVLTLVAIPVLKTGAIPFAFILYILLSVIYRQPETTTIQTAQPINN